MFNIALKSNDDQLGMLNKIIGTVQDEKLLKDAKTMSCSSLELSLIHIDVSAKRAREILQDKNYSVYERN